MKRKKYTVTVFIFVVTLWRVYRKGMLNLEEPHPVRKGVHETQLRFSTSHPAYSNSETISSSIINPKSLAVHNIAFLKVPKAGSSTIQNIMLRFGFNRNLTFLLPRKTNVYPNVIDFFEPINDKNTIPRRDNEEFNIMCCHVIYSRTAFRKYLPLDSFYIAIVREPYQRYVSWIAYFEKANVKVMNWNQTSFCDHLHSPKFDKEHRMAKTFGFPRSLMTHYNSVNTENYLNQLNADFNLVLVVEYFHESLVLMRRMLHWSTQDIIYMKMNDNKEKVQFKINNKNCTDLFYSKVKVDVHIYDYFYKEFWQKIRNEGSDFEFEVLHLKKIQSEVNQFCSLKSNTSLYVEALPWSDNFYLTWNDCQLLSLFEQDFIELIRKRQYENTDYA